MMPGVWSWPWWRSPICCEEERVLGFGLESKNERDKREGKKKKEKKRKSNRLQPVPFLHPTA